MIVLMVCSGWFIVVFVDRKKVDRLFIMVRLMSNSVIVFLIS